MNEFSTWVGAHQHGLDFILKIVGFVGTVIAACAVAWKYFSEKRALRLQREMDLRREAYIELFAVIPKQLVILGRTLRSDALEMCEDGFVALHRLHVLAGASSLQCLIERNAMYHIAMFQMIEMKQAIIAHRQAEGDEARLNILQQQLLDHWMDSVRKLNANYRELVSRVRSEIGMEQGLADVIAALKKDQDVAEAYFSGRLKAF